MVCETAWFEWGHIFVFFGSKKFFMASVKSTRWKQCSVFLIKPHRRNPWFFAYQLSASFFFYPVFIILLGEIFLFRSLSPSFFVVFMISPPQPVTSVIKIRKLDIAHIKREMVKERDFLISYGSAWIWLGKKFSRRL